MLKGAELKAGQFSFELKSRDGKVMSTAKNAADGSVTFDALTFKQAGTYTFTVSEVDDGQAHVTYDKAVRKIVVTVSDEAADGTKTGYLSARVSLRGDANVPPVFTNSYAENPGPRHPPRTPARRAAAQTAVQITAPAAALSGDGSKTACPTPATKPAGRGASRHGRHRRADRSGRRGPCTGAASDMDEVGRIHRWVRPHLTGEQVNTERLARSMEFG